MALYLIESPHTEEECATAGEQFIKNSRAREILDNTYWACSSGRHVAWTLIDVSNEAEARALVPEPVRSQIVATPVEVYTYDQMMQVHQ